MTWVQQPWSYFFTSSCSHREERERAWVVTQRVLLLCLKMPYIPSAHILWDVAPSQTQRKLRNTVSVWSRNTELDWWSISVQLLSRVQLLVAPWTTPHQASLSITSSWSLLKLMSMESVMPTRHHQLDEASSTYNSQYYLLIFCFFPC